MKPFKVIKNSYHWIVVALLIYMLVCSVSIVGGGFKIATADKAKELFYLATHPFVALMIGTVTTGLIQSSSTVTSIIVGLVAGGLPLEAGVPLIMGANIGTTITNTIVSFGHVNNTNEFKRAFAAATIHDLFNLLAVGILFPLELFTHYLEWISGYVASMFIEVGDLSINNFNYLNTATRPVTNFLKHLVYSIPNPTDGVVLVVMGIGLVFISIYCIGILLKKLMKKNAKAIVKKTVGRNDLSSFISGLLITIGVQSSSTSTAVVIPFAGQGILTLKELYPYTIGANVGTTITALLAATSVIENQQAALTIAMVHLFFNITAGTIIYSVPFLRKIPYNGALYLAEVTANKKWLAILYTLCIFFFIPGLVILVTH